MEDSVEAQFYLGTSLFWTFLKNSPIKINFCTKKSHFGQIAIKKWCLFHTFVITFAKNVHQRVDVSTYQADFCNLKHKVVKLLLRRKQTKT